MGRKTVRVDIPSKSPDKMLKLIADIIEQDAAETDLTKKLPAALIAALQAILDGAVPIRKVAAKLAEDSQKKYQQAETLIGTAEGQNSTTPGTGLFLVTDVKDKLLNSFKGNEEALSTYGFNAVIGMAKSPTKKPK